MMTSESQNITQRQIRHALLRTAWMLGCIMLVLSSPTDALAYRTAGDLAEFDGQARVRWETDTVQLEVLRPPLANVDGAQAEEGMAAALASWNGLDCGVVTLELNAETASPAAAGDRRNTIEWLGAGWVERGFSPLSAATTDVQYRRQNGRMEIVEVDLYINAEHFSWGAEGRDVQAVLVHEILHITGLLHVCEVGGVEGAPECMESHQMSALYPEYLGASQRELSSDDVAGACFLYEGAGSCTPDDCPSGYRCVADGCEPECGTECECSSDAECGAGRCDAGACVEVRPLGDPCAVDSECSSRVCHEEGYCSSACGPVCPEGFACDPTTDAYCSAERSTYGVACSHGGECDSSLCVSGSWFTAMCTRTCGSGTCPGVDACEVVDGRAVCTPPRVIDGGCSATGATGAGSAPWPLAGLLIMSLRRRRCS